MDLHRPRLALLPLLAALLLAGPAFADDSDSDSDRSGGRRVYEVTVTNLTKGQTFTPILVATHSGAVRLFRAGDPASRPLEILAEDGDTGPFTTLLERQGRRVGDVETIPGLLGPGESTRVRVHARGGQGLLSTAAMLIPTNDTFFAANGVPLPRRGVASFDVPAYDAGTEENDQDCAHMPGPVCGGEGLSPDPAPGDEGFVFVGNGFHELDPGNPRILGPLTYDWRNPVARVMVRRIR